MDESLKKLFKLEKTLKSIKGIPTHATWLEIIAANLAHAIKYHDKRKISSIEAWLKIINSNSLFIKDFLLALHVLADSWDVIKLDSALYRKEKNNNFDITPTIYKWIANPRNVAFKIHLLRKWLRFIGRKLDSEKIIENPYKQTKRSSISEDKKRAAAEIISAMREMELARNKEIAEYLKRHPIHNEIGKFGVPQDKYRWGFYGSSSMEYDIWRKGEKF